VIDPPDTKDKGDVTGKVLQGRTGRRWQILLVPRRANRSAADHAQGKFKVCHVPVGNYKVVIRRQAGPGGIRRCQDFRSNYTQKGARRDFDRRRRSECVSATAVSTQLRHRGACLPDGRTSLLCCVLCCVPNMASSIAASGSRSSPSLVPSRRGPASRVGRARAPARLPGSRRGRSSSSFRSRANTLGMRGAPAALQLVQTFPDVCRRQERVCRAPCRTALLELIDDRLQARGYLQGVDRKRPAKRPTSSRKGSPCSSGCPRRPAGPPMTSRRSWGLPSPGNGGVPARTWHDLGDPCSDRPVDLVVHLRQTATAPTVLLLQQRSVRPGFAPMPVHPPRPATGCPPGGRGLDDKLLGATSNAVERANRRLRKAQKSIYSVRTKEHLEQRLTLDMHREQRPPNAPAA